MQFKSVGAQAVRRGLGSVVLLVAGCGGGGATDPAGSDTPVTPVTPVAAPYFAGTAYLRAAVTHRYVGQSSGPNRAGVESLQELCNSIRKNLYDLPPSPSSLSEADLDAVDTYIEEKYFDTDKAATYTSGHTLLLSDMLRWTTDSKAGLPTVPPDCGIVVEGPFQTGTLWRAGIQYILNYKTRVAVGTRGGASFTPTRWAPEAQINALPTKVVMGQTCHDTSSLIGTTVIPVSGAACMWDRFPSMTYLNWPWALIHNVILGNTGSTQLEEIAVTEAVARDISLEAARLDVPAGFTVTVSN